MAEVRLSYNSIFSAMGKDSDAVFDAMRQGMTCLKEVQGFGHMDRSFWLSQVEDSAIESSFEALKISQTMTRLEQMMMVPLAHVIEQSGIEMTEDVGLIVSTTKGNVNCLDADSKFPKERAYLSTMARELAQAIGSKTEPLVLSNACVSGLLALSVAKRYIDVGRYTSVLVVSGDLLSEFVLSGFNSFQALSDHPCRPYCAQRQGINLGEAAAAALVTRSDQLYSEDSLRILGAGSCNDANHISGPSRTGEGLFLSVRSAVEEAEIGVETIDFISAHGTATQFNDEMESIAFNRLDLSHTPLNSLKGYIGHTLGSSGLLESIIGQHSIHKGVLIPSPGFAELGVSKPLNIIQEAKEQVLNCFLKTASGFGGCNAAMIFAKPAL